MHGIYYNRFSRLIKTNAPNGNNSKVIEVSSMNDEALGYMATYVIPLLYQDYSNLIDFCTMFTPTNQRNT